MDSEGPDENGKRHYKSLGSILMIHPVLRLKKPKSKPRRGSSSAIRVLHPMAKRSRTFVSSTSKTGARKKANATPMMQRAAFLALYMESR